MAVLPSDWRFMFLGSESSLSSINTSAAIRNHARTAKLQLGAIPENASTAGQEPISRFLTSRWLYETAVGPAEWLLVFQTDSMVCANSMLSVDDFLEFDWVGSPWNPEGTWGGNGGLSMRRVSRILEILRNQERTADSDPEDVWFSERLRYTHGSKMANGSVSLAFSGEIHSGEAQDVKFPWLRDGKVQNDGDFIEGLDDWRRGFYEPMGYHTGGGGIWLHGPLWGTPELRKHIWSYCPEIKMVLPMDVAQFVPGECGARW
ncbi:hypothetical protein HIM_07700 [Hirsutella minnesotensis 3608]|uniref:DUF5672 domain-containing protein n=1 Tax=Hirsutella minnesotensis 3608 TaxID=1043627 RepID=A0A0F7ZYR6_9HYPO|nr:hypothetical protein HIM_07700 [Hirsutella minnesotensis 3608]